MDGVMHTVVAQNAQKEIKIVVLKKFCQNIT